LDTGLPIGGVFAPFRAATLTQGAPSAGRRNEDDVNLVAFAQNQRDELRELEIASSVSAERWGTAKNETLLAVQGGSQQDQFVTPQGVVPTLAHASNTHSGHHEPKVWEGAAVRRLTPLECERLQGFPDGWTDIPSNSDTQRYRQLGNAVAVPVAEWIMRRL
jgi:DNA (cytosine-5)-methyltransferase 1